MGSIPISGVCSISTWLAQFGRALDFYSLSQLHDRLASRFFLPTRTRTQTRTHARTRRHPCAPSASDRHPDRTSPHHPRYARSPDPVTTYKAHHGDGVGIRVPQGWLHVRAVGGRFQSAHSQGESCVGSVRTMHHRARGIKRSPRTHARAMTRPLPSRERERTGGLYAIWLTDAPSRRTRRRR